MDVKTAFLHGDTEEKLYIKQPSGLAILDKEHLVCKLYIGRNKFLHSATKKFDAFMLSRGFKRDHADHRLCTKRDVVGNPNILVLYEDDMLMAGKNESEYD